MGIPFKNVSNEQGTNRNYIDNQADRPSDELLSRSVDGDVARTSAAQRSKNGDKSGSTLASGDDYTESSLNEKPTDSSIYYDGDKNNANANKHKSNNNGNKINLDYEPQPPSYGANDGAEAVPSVVDSKGGIHYSDGVGGTFGIVDELPGVLSNNDNHRAKNLNVYVKPLNGQLAGGLPSNTFDVYGSNGNGQLDKDLGLLERRSRKLFGEDGRRNNNNQNNNQNNNSENNNNNGYQYVPVITPEKLLFQTTRNPFDFQTSTQRHKNTGLSRSSASRPRGRVIYADFDEDERPAPKLENERQPKLINHNNNHNNHNNNHNPVEAEVEALLHNLNQPPSRDNLHHISINHNDRNSSGSFDHPVHSGNAQSHFVNGNHQPSSSYKQNKPPAYNSNAEIIVVPIHRTPGGSSSNANNRNKPATSQQLNSAPNNQANRPRNPPSPPSPPVNRNREPIRHPRLEPGVLPAGSNGFIGVIFDDEDPSYNEQPVELPSPPPIPSIVEGTRTRNKQRGKFDLKISS